MAVRLCPSTWKVNVELLGGGPGLYFDFARSSFHVPTDELLCANPICGKAVANTNARVSVVRRLMMFLLDIGLVLGKLAGGRSQRCC
jgi:hypothetical protein